MLTWGIIAFLYKKEEDTDTRPIRLAPNVKKRKKKNVKREVFPSKEGAGR
jgi:hypothetical protein